MVAFLLGVLLVSSVAQAQYGSEYGRDYGSEYGRDYGSEYGRSYGSQESESYSPELDALRNWGQREQRRYEQNLPAIREREGRSACDAIQGNSAARADCYRGLGGW